MRICVFCGSKAGNNAAYADAARTVGAYFVDHDIELVYGGGHVGLMGIIADNVMQNGGKTFGVIPEALAQKELAHEKLTQLYIVPDMHARKMKMADLSDAFIALPGGAGTLEEIFEQWTWLQLSIHDKPSAFLNVEGYFDPLQSMVAKMVAEGFLSKEHADMVKFCDSIEEICESFETFSAPTPKWVDLAGPSTAI